MTTFLTVLLIYLLMGIIIGIWFVIQLSRLEKTIEHTVSKHLTWVITLAVIAGWPIIFVMRFTDLFHTPDYKETVASLLYLDNELTKDLEEDP